MLRLCSDSMRTCSLSQQKALGVAALGRRSPVGLSAQTSIPAGRSGLQPQRQICVRVEPKEGRGTRGSTNGDDPADGQDSALESLGRVWSGWDAKQKAYAVVAAGALLLVGPQLLTVLLIPLERLLVGSLLLLEEAIALFLLQGARVLGLLAALALLGAGVYLFVFNRQTEK